MENEMGTLYWLTGLSGAGKTTVGKLFYEELKKQCPNSIFMDCDDMRQILSNFDYSEAGRMQAFEQNVGICEWLTSQGINVVMCGVGMRDFFREKYRARIKNYQEIYLKVSIEELIRRDSKGLYQKALEGTMKNVMGINMDYEEPTNSDVVINNEGTTSVEDAVAILVKKYIQNM